MNRARVILLNDVPISDAVAAKLVTFVEGGGGLLMALGQRASWPRGRAAWLPATIGQTVDRTRGAARRARAAWITVTRSSSRFARRAAADFSTRALLFLSQPDARRRTRPCCARFDTGEPALVETRGRPRPRRSCSPRRSI